MAASARSTISLPKVRITQLEMIAEKRGLPNPAALINEWIDRAVAEGEIPNLLPGFSATIVGEGQFLIRIAEHVLPLLAPDRARMLAAVLSAVAGETDPELGIEMPAGRPVVLDLGKQNKVAIGRAGRGVKLHIKGPDYGEAEGEGLIIATSPAFVAGLANQIRAAFTTH
ncbi:hypothetical protein [Methylobacterium oxalidis]|uniref:hypothetical protein n=1 Tax=Methylobacterium oxalidis TaxID=944322 RepID=UPI003314A980